MTNWRRFWDWLMTKLRIKKAHTENDADLYIANGQGETNVMETVIPVMGYDPDTKKLYKIKNEGSDWTFTGDLDINGHMYLDGATMHMPYRIYAEDAGGARGDLQIQLGDKAGADRFQILDSDVAEVFYVTSDGRVVADAAIVSATDLQSTDDVIVGDDLVLGLTQRVTLDDDADTYIASPSDDRIDFYVGGVQLAYMTGVTADKVFVFTGGWYDMNGRSITNLWHLRCDVTTTPGAVANHCFFYGKDVSAKCEAHCMDEDGNETQLSSHDEKGMYVHRSTIPKRNISLQIDIEQMFRDNPKLHKYIHEEAI